MESKNEKTKGAMLAKRLLPPPAAWTGWLRDVWGTAVLAVAGFLTAGRPAAASSDAVEDLRQVLRPDRLPTDKAGYDARKKSLLMKVDKLESIVDLSRAVVLSDWRYADRDLELQGVDLAVFKTVA